ncbi:MAG: metal ABC transporter ATP-binding protein [Prolixibacteraceae bacterium]|jgi:zinc transport system ATP-binding protein|nr:metal ABC transporter ATP-binding protein [Prolixibacteraceae bacterium]
MSTLIEIKNLTVTYNKTVALENANMVISKNDFIGVIGPNGGGKTTLLKAILGLQEATSGEILFSDGLKNKGSDIGYLPQVNKFDNKFPITVFEVVLSGLIANNKWFSKNNNDNKTKCLTVLHELGIENLASKLVGELSGGQMQKVFLGRALISNPKLLILDEPDTYVDSRFENELYQKLKELNNRMAILLVSHDVGTISAHVKSIACVSRELHYHPSNIISPEQLASYNCPIQIITHGDVPHTVLGSHNHHQ